MASGLQFAWRVDAPSESMHENCVSPQVGYGSGSEQRANGVVGGSDGGAGGACHWHSRLSVLMLVE